MDMVRSNWIVIYIVTICKTFSEYNLTYLDKCEQQGSIKAAIYVRDYNPMLIRSNPECLSDFYLFNIDAVYIPNSQKVGICKSNSRQYEQTKVVKFYDDDNNLHFISLASPEISELIFLQSHRKLHDNVRFWLYTRKNKNNYEELYIDSLTNDTHFNPINPLIIVTHGWWSSGFSICTQWTKNAFLETRDVNVVVVDWKADAAYINYIWSAFSTTLVAEQIRDMVMALSRKYNLNGGNMHLIGHSLGAHVVGLAGIKLRHQEFIVDRVTGLDPARPLFEHPPIFPSITKKSAKFVDIIHTNVGVLGYESSIGHADFYPNGGNSQPHCCSNWEVFSCEHTCSYIYFQEAIQGITYISTRCDSYISYLLGFCYYNDKQLMGLPKTTARGSYFLHIPY